jgi:hypothetical protein
MSTRHEEKEQREIELIATYRLCIIKWLITNDAEQIKQASNITEAHDQICQCTECGLNGFAARHIAFVADIKDGHAASWHRLLSWFGSDGMTGFYKMVQATFERMIQSEFVDFYKKEYLQLLAISPFGQDHNRACMSVSGSTITLECHDRASVLAFLSNIGLPQGQLEALASINLTDQVVYDIILGRQGLSADTAASTELCLI